MRSRSWCATPASASRPSSRRASSANSSRPTAARRASSAAPASALRSRSASSSAWAAASRSRARPGQGSTFRVDRALPRADGGRRGVGRPTLAGAAMLIVAPATVEAALLARRLDALGRRPERCRERSRRRHAAARTHWDAVLVDHALGAETAVTVAGSIGDTVARRIVLIDAERAPSTAGAEAGGLHRLSGQADPRGLARGAARRLRPRAPRPRFGRRRRLPRGRRPRRARLSSWSPRTTRSTRC